MAIKKAILKKKIEGVVYDIYAKTSADLVTYDETSTVAQKIAAILTTLEDMESGENSVDSKISKATTALYNQIMGITEEDGATVSEAFDTLKEVANYLNSHDSVVEGFTNDINDLKTTVGDSESGLVKDVAELKAVVSSGELLLKDATTDKIYSLYIDNSKLYASEVGVDSNTVSANNLTSEIIKLKDQINKIYTALGGDFVIEESE